MHGRMNIVSGNTRGNMPLKVNKEMQRASAISTSRAYVPPSASDMDMANGFSRYPSAMKKNVTYDTTKSNKLG